ncbi:hypothetical protein AMAG_00744 [Allomyces macrogynus ATCC 38327]|uniref:SnoaL-like domain-containing protein n=1 Tax=Allomyces macrogynus (strain ATCC 38327) TaxID=578462 RepID=A0A0L0RXB3_ALLM3|nr:hypothetical protein AMAG_00744 [Allomyces macrogynus ATCC 38327]|eukprot:KNE54790.1 hypothetical protein AMAG_00744 [Allomyces macrogynus ATCC 38327]
MTRGPTRHSSAPTAPPLSPLSPLSQPHSKRGTADVATDVIEAPRPPAPRDIALNVHAAMYSVQPDAQAAAARDYLDENATFADPIVIAATSDSVKTAFMGNKLAFALVEPKITSVTEGTDDAGNHVVAVDADIAYTLRLLPIKLTVRTLSKFVIDSGSNRVVFHEDIWSVADLMEQIPIVGTLYSSLARPFASSMTSMLVAMLLPKQAVPPSTSSANGSGASV